VEQHHECWDGSGYPLGLKGEEIHPIARILAVADNYDALYADRPYREGWSQDRVINHLTQNSVHMFDPTVIEALFWAVKEVDALPAGWATVLRRDVI
jgi:HD-GYP domain-containing protein (c-di-GMP phosphodiesterase class II)